MQRDNNVEFETIDRIQYIDALRGIAMIAVVLQHANNPGSPTLTRVLLSFHMPLFFFISGMLMNGRDYNKISFGHYLRRLTYKIVIPLMTYTVIQDVAEIFISGTIPSISVLLGPLKNWFLVTLFFMKLISYGKYRLVRERKIVVVLIAEVIIFCLCRYTKIKFVQTTLCALVFGDLGYILRPYIEKIYANFSETHALGLHMRGGGDSAC